MNRLMKQISSMFIAALLFCFTITAMAEELPNGTVAGLPEQLVVMDSDGKSVNENGEYFFSVENMKAGEQYTKNIQVMNMREDKAYDIYFKMEPVSKQGEIDLEEECTAIITIGDEKVYEGKVSGKDSDILEKGIGLGNYVLGQSRNMKCTIVWNGTDAGGHIDYGERIISSDGTSIVREKNGQESISGEVEFRWIFYANVDTNYNPPKTGFYSEIFLYVILFIAAVLLISMIILVTKKKRKMK